MAVVNAAAFIDIDRYNRRKKEDIKRVRESITKSKNDGASREYRRVRVGV